MASVTSYFFCDSRKEKRIKSKATALCYSCQKLLCDECKICHLTFKDDNDFNLVYLRTFLSDPSFYQNLPSLKSAETFDESELTSLYDDIVLRIKALDTCNSSEIHTESASSNVTSSLQQLDPRRMRSRKDIVFSVKKNEDRNPVRVTGLLCIEDTLVVVDRNNSMLKLFDVNGGFLSSTKVEDAIWGITLVQDKTFATCCTCSYKIYLWTVHSKKILQKSLLNQLGNPSDGIHFNGAFFSLLHCKLSAVSILDAEGRNIRMVHVKEICQEKIQLGLDIHMDTDTNNIYLSCYSTDGILCMTIEGQALWFLRLSTAPQGIIDIHGTLYVADFKNGSIHLISKNGQYVSKLLDTEYGLMYMCSGGDGKLYVSYNIMGNERNIISVFKLDDDEGEGDNDVDDNDCNDRDVDGDGPQCSVL